MRRFTPPQTFAQAMTHLASKQQLLIAMFIGKQQMFPLKQRVVIEINDSTRLNVLTDQQLSKQCQA